jgi:hypothetical protein
VSWTDSTGNLWLFGGFGVDASGTGGDLNDLWEFNPATNEWAWMSGSSTMEGCFSIDDGYINCGISVPGTLGAPAPGNTPGGREWASSWTDSKGNLWLFGGQGFDPKGNYCALDDLWEFNTTTKEWAWMNGGSTTTSCQTDSGGGVITWTNFNESEQGRRINGRPRALDTPAATTSGVMPAGRYFASSWTDHSGNLWLFGGVGISGELNDLWAFDPSMNVWTFVIGGSTAELPGVYGTIGKPATGNVPGAREFALTWTDTFGNLWLFGGTGFDGTGNGKIGFLNDLWEFYPSLNEWAWMGGSSAMNCSTSPTFGPVCFDPGEYGSLGSPSTGNIPAGRYGEVAWTDTMGNFWLFGGILTNDTVQGSLNDLWEYQPYAFAASPTFSVASGTYTSTQAVTITNSTPDATIYYTTDGTTPDTSSTVYSGPIIVSSTETLKAIATASGYVASAVATAAYTIPPDFTLTINPPSISVQSGQSGTATITVQDNGGFNSNVSFACSGLPAGAACSFSTLTVPTPEGIAYTTLTVTSSTAAATLHRTERPLFPGSVLTVVFCCFGWKRRRRLPMLLLLAAISVAGLTVLNGCGGASSTVTAHLPSISTVTVTATSGTLSHTATFSLTVN